MLFERLAFMSRRKKKHAGYERVYGHRAVHTGICRGDCCCRNVAIPS